jgi:hypothetical protein
MGFMGRPFHPNDNWGTCLILEISVILPILWVFKNSLAVDSVAMKRWQPGMLSRNQAAASSAGYVHLTARSA